MSGLLLLMIYGQTNLSAQSSLSILDTIQVKTTRLPLSLKETGRNISVIEGKDLQKMAFTSLDDLLQFIPGIEVQSRGAFGVQGDISMRGATFTQVQVLVNGMKLNDPLTGHFNGYMPVTPAEIERIEVLRGAASAMYGVNYGENRLINAQQGFSVQKEKFYVGGGFNINKSDGQAIAAQQVGETLLDAYNTFFDIKTLGLSLGYKINDRWNLQARTSYDDRHFNARYFYTTSTFDKSVETTRNWWNQIQLSNVGAKSSTDFKFAYRNGTDEFVFSPDFPSTNFHTTNFWNFNVNHLRIINKRHSLKFGGQIDRRSVESTDRGNHDDLHYGIYVTNVFRPTKRWNIIGSMRLDYDDNYELEFTPQLNVSYVLSKLTLRATAGRSIRAADYTERYVSFNLENLTPGRSLGNPDLIAESAWSEEIGFDYKVSNNWQIKTTAFARQSDNLIDFVSTNETVIPNNTNLQSDANYFYATNVTEVQTKGIEIESWLRKTISSTAQIQWSLGYTYLNTTNE